MRSGNSGTGVETLWERNGLPWEHSAGNQWEGGQAETRSLTVNGVRAVGWAGRGRDRKPNFVACSARIVCGWLVVV